LHQAWSQALSAKKLAVRLKFTKVDFVGSMESSALSAKKLAVRVKLATEVDFVASTGPPMWN
jgi:hypothetical protein